MVKIPDWVMDGINFRFKFKGTVILDVVILQQVLVFFMYNIGKNVYAPSPKPCKNVFIFRLWNKYVSS